MKLSAVILALHFSFAAGFSTLLSAAEGKWLPVRVKANRIDQNFQALPRKPNNQNYRSLPRKPKATKTNHVLSNPYLNAINRPSKRSALQAYWKKMHARGVTRMLANALLAYLFVGSASRCIVFSCSWYLASKQTLLPPLAPGQWTNFSRVYEQTFANWYAIFVIMLHIARPVRVSLALAVSGYWNTMVYSLKKQLKVNHVAAVALVALFVDILGSCVLLAAGVAFASLFSGVPFWR